MEFCPKCGGMIKVENKTAFCMSCGYKSKKAPKIETSEKIVNNEAVVIVKEGQDNTNPIIDINCIKCKNKKAYFWT